MTVRLIHKQGDTFLIDCQAFSDLDLLNPRDLTGVTVTAAMDAPFRDPYDFTVSVTNAALGEFQLEASAADTEDWGIRTWYASVSYTESGVRTSTETFQIQVIGNYNTATG